MESLTHIKFFLIVTLDRLVSERSVGQFEEVLGP
jgi:hypothetical protein